MKYLFIFLDKLIHALIGIMFLIPLSILYPFSIIGLFIWDFKTFNNKKLKETIKGLYSELLEFKRITIAFKEYHENN